MADQPSSFRSPEFPSGKMAVMGLGILSLLLAGYIWIIHSGYSWPLFGSLDPEGWVPGPSRTGPGLIFLFFILAAGGIGWLISRSATQSLRHRLTEMLQALHTASPGTASFRRIVLPGKRDQVSELSESYNLILEHLEKVNGTLQDLETDFERLFNQGISANVWIDPEGRILRCNQAFAGLLGYRAVKEVVGLSLASLLPDPEEWPSLAAELQIRKKIEKAEWELLDRNRNPVPVRGKLLAPVKTQGPATRVLGTFWDQSRLKNLEQNQIRFHGQDPLTGLINRTAFEKEMTALDSGEFDPVGILMADVNGLKFVNDNLGFEEADRLLQEAGRILREAFPGNERIARVGGDEFAVLGDRVNRRDFEEARGLIRREVEAYNAEHPELPLSLAVGVALNDEAPCTVREIFTLADNNMYREKLLCTQSIHSSVVQTLNKALEVRDFITEGHARRIQGLAEKMAKTIGLPDRSVIDMRLLAQFHDIGKVGIPDRVLMKPGPLTPQEAIEMQKHCEIGYRIALAATDLVPIADWILKHHEWWNGHGYPGGLKGERIPLECRILALADAYDVLTNDRPYRRAVSHAEAIEEIQRYSAIQFDPFLVKKFCQLFPEPETS